MIISPARIGCFVGLLINHALLSLVWGISALMASVNPFLEYYDNDNNYKYADSLANITAQIRNMTSGFLIMNLVLCILVTDTYSAFQLWYEPLQRLTPIKLPPSSSIRIKVGTFSYITRSSLPLPSS